MPKKRQRRNPVPKAPPKRRFAGQPVTPRQLSSSLARVRAMSGQLDERERAFDPSRAPTWRGSSRDLVVNGRASLKDGYAYEFNGNEHWSQSLNDDWDQVMITEGDAVGATEIGQRRIDGATCIIFRAPSGAIYAQTKVRAMSRNGEVDPRDIPAHLHGAELRDEPTHNGQDVGYSQGMRGRSAEWFQVEYATGSDYSGGSVNESNYRVLAELLDEHHPEDAQPVVWARTSGGHGTYGIAVRYGDLEEEVREAIDALEDYPLMDEEDHSNLEMEQQQAAWDDWGVSELSKSIAKATGADRDELKDNLTDDDWYRIFNLVMELGDISWEDQQGAGAYIDMDDVAKRVVQFLEDGLPSYATEEQDRAYELLGNLVGAPEED